MTQTLAVARAASIAMAVCLALLCVGCKKKHSAQSSACTAVSRSVLDAVAVGLRDHTTTLRHAFAVDAKDHRMTFVSAELVVRGREKDAGPILTWTTATASTPANDFEAADEEAVKSSTWPKAPKDVNPTIDELVQSRACVAAKRP